MDTVLIVDASPNIRQIAASCLKEHGMKAIFAGNGREALDVMAKQRPDAVLTDLHMPEMDGLKLVEHIRNKYPSVPVVLMTDHGSEKTAAEALKAGAASYVPKADLKTNLCDAMGVVVAALEAKHYRERVRKSLQYTESHYTIGNELDERLALVSHLQNDLAELNFCDETILFQISTALTEALDNAVDHGNLELDSATREARGRNYDKLREERKQQSPFRDRKVYVTERLTRAQATYVILDGVAGFDSASLPDPKNAANLLKVSGRGIMLIQTFMDEVTFNEAGNEITMIKRRAIEP